MKTYLYLSLTPESLIASQLPPEEFGAYLAVGTWKRSRSQVLFFELQPGFSSDYLRTAEADERCREHGPGFPRRSAYLSVYRVLEHVPTAYFGTLHLITDAGRHLALDDAPLPVREPRNFFLYQEIAPITPCVASTLHPAAFAARITDRRQPVSVERLVFAELELGALGLDPNSTDVANLPYDEIDHLRECLHELRRRSGKTTKTVARRVRLAALFRSVHGGFYVGAQDGVKYYPLPSRADLETKHAEWWRSALASREG